MIGASRDPAFLGVLGFTEFQNTVSSRQDVNRCNTGGMERKPYRAAGSTET